MVALQGSMLWSCLHPLAYPECFFLVCGVQSYRLPGFFSQKIIYALKRNPPYTKTDIFTELQAVLELYKRQKNVAERIQYTFK